MSALDRALTTARPPTVVVRASQLFTVALIASFSLAIVTGWAIGGGWKLIDMDVYWTAAQQWRATGNPYTVTAMTTDHTVFRYAPWFAAVWVPLTYLPRPVVDIGWSVILLGAAVAAVMPVLRAYGRRAVPLATLMLGLLVGMAASGNVQPLLIAWLAWGIDRRSGPLWIALAASLKAVPILYAIVFIGRRQWWRAVATVALTALLTAPMLLFQLPPLVTAFGGSNSLSNVSLALWAAVATAAIVVAIILAFRRSRYAWLATGAAVVLALPRLFLYDTTFILPGVAETADTPGPRHAS
jgi:hypothetical protein